MDQSPQTVGDLLQQQQQSERPHNTQQGDLDFKKMAQALAMQGRQNSGKLEQLEAKFDQVMEMLSERSLPHPDEAMTIEQSATNSRLEALEGKLDGVADRIADLAERQAKPVELPELKVPEFDTTRIDEQLTNLSNQLNSLAEGNARLGVALAGIPKPEPAPKPEELGKAVASHVEGALARMVEFIIREVHKVSHEAAANHTADVEQIKVALKMLVDEFSRRLEQQRETTPKQPEPPTELQSTDKNIYPIEDVPSEDERSEQPATAEPQAASDDAVSGNNLATSITEQLPHLEPSTARAIAELLAQNGDSNAQFERRTVSL